VGLPTEIWCGSLLLPTACPSGAVALITAGGYAAGLGASAFGVPVPYPLAALVLGMVPALSGAIPERIPGPVNRCSQVLAGALTASYLSSAALMTAAPLALPLTAVTAATVVLSLVIARGMARAGAISRPSGLLGMVPGGSAAIVSRARTRRRPMPGWQRSPTTCGSVWWREPCRLSPTGRPRRPGPRVAAPAAVKLWSLLTGAQQAPGVLALAARASPVRATAPAHANPRPSTGTGRF
jgi:hypothetical protein